MPIQVPATYTLMMVRDALDVGVDLLKDFKINLQDIENKEYVSEELSTAVMSRYSAFKHDRPDWGFEFGDRLGIASHGPLGFGAISARTVRDGLALLADYIQTRAAHVSCTLHEAGDRMLLVRFHLDALPSGDDIRRCETFAMVFQSYLRTVGASAAPTLWRFPYDEPAHAAAYARWLGGGYVFGHSHLEFEVPGSVAMMVSPFYSQAAYETSKALCEALLADGAGAVDAQVEAMVATAIRLRMLEPVPVTPVPRIEDVADRLNISRRTLIRRLDARSTSFQAIKDGVLRTQILTALPGGGRLQDLADRMGYGDAGNFTRACRRLFGKSPSRLRDDALAGRATHAAKDTTVTP